MKAQDHYIILHVCRNKFITFNNGYQNILWINIYLSNFYFAKTISGFWRSDCGINSLIKIENDKFLLEFATIGFRLKKRNLTYIKLELPSTLIMC